jgi:AraC-like DNA-binding protein
MSQRFLNDLSLNVQESFTTWLSVKQNACVPLEERGLNAMINYFNMMKDTLQIKDNPYRMQIAINLTRAFFYGAGYHFHNFSNTNTKSHNEELTEKFLNLVQIHYKQERGLNFYAEKMCITPKHLAKVIKENSTRSANEWIDEYVVLMAKALLKSTNMTIQQIADDLNFPSQSFFGKYFKRIVGISPREYKKK